MHQKHYGTMLSVPTYLAPSRISGMGLFAAKDLPAGTRIWAFSEGVDWRLSQEELESFPEPYRGRLRHYVYRDVAGFYVLCGDNAKFMNHDPDPNCSDADPTFTITLRPIPAGSELTCNYLEFDYDSRRDGLTFPEVHCHLG